MSCLMEELVDPLCTMEERLLTKTISGWVEWKNFSKLLKDMHGYLTARMLLFWICKWRTIQKKVKWVYFSRIWSTWKYCLLYYFNLKFLLGPNGKKYTKKALIWAIKSIKIIWCWKNAAATPTFCYWYLKIGLLNLKMIKLTKYLMSLLCIPGLTKSEW